MVAVASDSGRPSTVTSDGGERIDSGERLWSGIDDSDNNFGDNSRYNCSGGDSSGEIQ